MRIEEIENNQNITLPNNMQLYRFNTDLKIISLEQGEPKGLFEYLYITANQDNPPFIIQGIYFKYNNQKKAIEDRHIRIACKKYNINKWIIKLATPQNNIILINLWNDTGRMEIGTTLSPSELSNILNAIPWEWEEEGEEETPTTPPVEPQSTYPTEPSLEPLEPQEPQEPTQQESVPPQSTQNPQTINPQTIIAFDDETLNTQPENISEGLGLPEPSHFNIIDTIITIITFILLGILAYGFFELRMLPLTITFAIASLTALISLILNIYKTKIKNEPQPFITTFLNTISRSILIFYILFALVTIITAKLGILPESLDELKDFVPFV